jgi:IclR family transcriptional regulator, acetate operon repressor
MSKGAAEREPVKRALELLVHMAEGEHVEWGVRQLAAELGVAAGSLHRTLSSLVNAGFVEAADGQYALGAEAVRFAHLVAARSSLQEVAAPCLRALVEKCDETALLGEYSPARREMRFTLSVESSNLLRYVVPLHVWQPVHAGASGLGILAFLPEEERREIVDAALPPVTEATIVDRVELVGALDAIREAGYACTRGERIVGAVGLAAPIHDQRGRVLGDVCLTVPQQRFAESDGERLGALVVAAAEDISARMGHVRAGSGEGA